MKTRIAKLATFVVGARFAGAIEAMRISPWSTDSLSWSTPENVTIVRFGPSNPLRLPAPFSMMLRVHDADRCAPVDSDLSRSMWWAEIRRHVPDETGLAAGAVSVKHLPPGMTPEKVGLRNGCSTIAFVPQGYDGSETLKVAPSDEEGVAAFVGWVGSSFRTFCKVVNPMGEALTLYWVDDTLEEKRLLDVAARGDVPQNTFVGHVFVARRASTGGVVDWWTMSGAKEHVIEDKAAVLETSCQAPTSGRGYKGQRLGEGGEEAAALGMVAGKACVGAEEAMFNFLYDRSMFKRHALNTVQPTVVHSYSDVGYKVLPLPEKTFAWLKQWYHDNANSEIKESSAGAVGTQHIAPWYVRHLHHQLKGRLIQELRPILAEWSGFEAESLEMTSIYGIRRYTRGSVLRMHVDTTVTHVVSAIVNVDQVGVEQDWPLEIKSHDGQFHYVNMKPGDMLLYESARCLHGRPQPFEGDSYANIFLHFKPTAPGAWDYDWY